MGRPSSDAVELRARLLWMGRGTDIAAPVLAPHRADLDDVKPFGSFVAGLWDHHAVVGSRGRMAGLQVNFSPIGARLLLNQPLEAFANRMIELYDVWGVDARRLTRVAMTGPSSSSGSSMIRRR